MTPPSRLTQTVATVVIYLFFILLAVMVLMPSGEADPPRPTPAAAPDPPSWSPSCSSPPGFASTTWAA